MLYRPSIRQKAFALAAVATLATGSTASLTTAKADDTMNKFAAACEAIKNVNVRAGCYLDAIHKHTAQVKAEGQAADARGAAADARGAAADDVTDCARFIAAGIKSGLFLKSDVFDRAGGKPDEANACRVAKSFGYGKKAEAGTLPRLN